MNDEARRQLHLIIVRYGPQICEDPRRCEALLRDFCGEHRGEIHVLIGALKDRVAADLLARNQRVPTEVLLATLTKRLQDHLALTRDAAQWAVDSWATALGETLVVSKAGHGQLTSIGELIKDAKPGIGIPTLQNAESWRLAPVETMEVSKAGDAQRRSHLSNP